MKNRLRALLCLLLLFFVLTIRCKKDNAPSPQSHNDLVTATVEGRIVDENDIPVNNVTVKAGINGSNSTIAQTDVNGVFRFTAIQLNKFTGFVKVEKEGYFTGSRTFITSTKGTNYVKIKLIKKVVSGTFSNITGGTISPSNGGSIKFSDNSVVTASGNSYTGDVLVSAFYIDPSAIDLNKIMPGQLIGIDANNNEVGLQSYGMVAVELNGANGEKLNLAQNKTATVSLPIPLSLLTSAPATIPLWYFEEATGLWKEEGLGTKQGSNYTGEVRHFSYWNYDNPSALMNVEAVLKDPNNILVSAADVEISSNMGYRAVCITDSAGTFNCKVPKNERLTLKAFDDCGVLLLTKDIGSFPIDKDLGTLTTTIFQKGLITITGTAVTCTDEPLTNGYISVSMNGKIYRGNINGGTFSLSIKGCNFGSGKIVVGDVNNMAQSTLLDTVFSTSNIALGKLTACNNEALLYEVSTVAGNSPSAAFIADPTGITVDLQGNVFFATGHRINKMTPAGIVSIFAGFYPGYKDGVGQAAEFRAISHIGSDSHGNIYVSDFGNYRIRKITPSGVVSTLAGSGKIGNANGNAVDASFYIPKGIAVDNSGNVFVAEAGNVVIRKITPSGIVSTFAGTGIQGHTDGNGNVATFGTPSGLTIDPQGNLFLTEYNYFNGIRKITPSGVVSTIAGGLRNGYADGQGTQALFAVTRGITIDKQQNLYVTDNDFRVRAITPSGKVTTIAGSGFGTGNGRGDVAQFSSPDGITIDINGNIYVADGRYGLIRKIIKK